VRARAHRSGLSLAWDVILAQPWFSHPSAALSRFATLVTCLWYGGVAGDGLRSAEEVTFPIQGRLLYPSHRARRLRAGVSLGTSLGPRCATKILLAAAPATTSPNMLWQLYGLSTLHINYPFRANFCTRPLS